jgi:phosphoglycolate phosphatase-like HAD superfamily hydrolase
MTIVVFDIDGTIADDSLRQHHLRGEKKNWKLYNQDAINDEKINHVTKLLIELSVNHIIILCTAREETISDITKEWLKKNKLNKFINDLYMRPKGDYRSDGIVKVELLNRIRKEHGEPWLWFDDRQEVVDALRGAGVRVMQVAPGNF